MEKHKNIPELRFPEFDGIWICKELREIGKFIGGGTPSTKVVHFWNGNIPWVSSSDLTEESIQVINASRFITKDAVAKSATKLVPEKSILIVSRVGVGKVAVNEIEICTSQDFTNLIPDTDNYLFLAYLIKLNANRLLEFNQGTSIKGFVKSDLDSLRISLPSLSEQQKIASFLTSVDTKLTQLKQKKSLLEQYKKGVMQKIFSQEIRFKDENGLVYPEWEKKKLGDIGETYNGLTGKTKENFGQGKPYIQYKQIFDDSKIDISRFEYVEIGNNEKQNKVSFGDIFFTVSSETPNEIGTASVLLDKVDELYLNSFCFGYRPYSLVILNPYFARYIFRSQQFRSEVVKLAQGSTRYNMSKIQLMKLEIDLPCLTEQTIIANFLSLLEEKINHCQLQIEKTILYKKGLLQKMFC